MAQQPHTRLPWHSHEAEQVLTHLQSSHEGLSLQEVQARLESHGPNRLPSPPKQPPWRRFVQQFHNILIYVLLGAAVVTLLLGHAIDSAVIACVVLINAVIGYLQEGKAEKSMEAIRNMLAPHAAVLRGGERHTAEGESLVPGDIVLLEAGDKAPADLRLLKAHRLQMQEAILTGESVPVDKHIRPVVQESALGDRGCMVFSGTLVTAGQGCGVVVDTGAQTEIGRISGLLAEVEQLSTPLTRQMERFGKWLTGVIMAIALLVFAYGYVVQGMAFGDLFMAVVGLAVAAIPEGLPAVLTITLATGVQAMARRKAIVRRLPAIETIGAVSVICSDKTGTLTRNEMMVASVLTARHCFTVEGNGYAPQGKFFCTQEEQDVTQHPLLQRMGRAAALCNDAALQEDAQNGWCVEGDPMEGALLAFAAKAGAADVQEKRLDAIPFDARHRFMATLHADELFVKGAPEKLLELAQQQEGPDGPQPLDVGYWQHEAEAIAALGQRVLALGYKPVQQEALDFADVEQGVILLGMVGMIDPPRPEAMQAVKECHAAGIAVKMITGDHAATAAAIGRQIGLQQTQSVLSGQEIEQLDEAALREAVMATDIFARTSPEHKLRLVMALQAQGLIVAMTGDGVNDAPALKRADAGIAMGLKGSEAAKEAAELVLADDHFATIVAAVREGRTVYDNLKKVISWTLPTNGGEAMTILVALLFGLALPVTPVQILWVNLITAVTLGIALAFEPTEEKTMQRPPRAQDEALLSGSLVWMILLVSCLFAGFVFGVYNYVLAQGHPVEMARTMAVNTLVVLEIFNLFFIRNLYGTSLTWQMIRGTRVMWAVIVVITLAQFAFTYAPPLQKVFVTQGLPLSYGLMVVGCGVVLFVLLELEKQIRLRFWQRG